MPIRKQEFYEGAALYQLARAGCVDGLRYDSPFMIVNGSLAVLIKYSAGKRSPWAFTFTPDEQRAFAARAGAVATVAALVCGSDGVTVLRFSDFVTVAQQRDVAVRISCFRRFGEHYEVSGPEGVLKSKVAPSDWRRVLEEREP
jgi:hypothetical protein